MSEANAPFNRPGQPESTNAPFSNSDDFANPFGEMPEMESEEDASARSIPFHTDAMDNSVLENSSESLKGKKTADRPFPNAAQSVTIAPDMENWLNSSEPTDLADLISLIQELNQCNSILLDRVSQLEEALDRSQSALKAEVKRSQNHAFADYNPSLTAAQDLAAAQEQAIDLYNQLEFVHQTSQRQQILIETLTSQLETSQERVAQLEREAALVQQRYNEQTQLLAQSENNCRDLQARLHRQQRYTLQFKVALEKSLDVSTPHYDPVAEALGVASSAESFLPKVQHIEPWTSPVDISPARFPWMKLSSEPLKNEPVPARPAAQSPAQADMPFEAVDIPVAKPRRSKLASIKLPGFQTVAQSAAASDSLNPEAPAPVDLSAVPNEKLMQKLDSMVQPLADLLAEAVLTEVNTSSSAASDAGTEPVLNSAAQASMDYSDYSTYSTEPLAADVPSTNADELLNSVMADAEDALWQDLARLIDVSTEDVVKASLSGDLSAFESIDFNALQPEVAPVEPTARRNQQPTAPVQSSTFAATESTLSTESAAFFGEQEPIADEPTNSPAAATPPASVFGATPSWPAPLIYPTRPAKKRRSLAAVDLPSFLQQQPGPLPT